MNKSVIFLLLALACIWLVLNDFYGTNLITRFIKTAIPTAEGE